MKGVQAGGYEVIQVIFVLREMFFKPLPYKQIFQSFFIISFLSVDQVKEADVFIAFSHYMFGGI